MTETDETALQRLVASDEQAQEMLDDLEDPEELVPEGEDPEDLEGWELALSFGYSDIPYIVEELEELVDDEQ